MVHVYVLDLLNGETIETTSLKWCAREYNRLARMGKQCTLAEYLPHTPNWTYYISTYAPYVYAWAK